MKKMIICALLTVALILSLASCGGSGDAVNSGNADVDTEGKILVAYFTAAENSGVDAVSSASVVTVDGEAKGVSQAVAEMIAGETGADIFSIRTSTVYPANMGELIGYADKEQDDDARPELTSSIDNLDDYATVFVGFPIWWYDMPQVMYSFFDEYDFSGKTIIPFTVHNGSRLSGTPAKIAELEPDATVISDGFTVSMQNAANAGEDVAEWLRGLGF